MRDDGANHLARGRRLRPPDIEQLAIHLHEDLACPSADILNALLAAKPGVSYLATARPNFRPVLIEPEQ
jgi:hypothetical protein